jgi:hypothetical protein
MQLSECVITLVAINGMATMRPSIAAAPYNLALAFTANFSLPLKVNSPAL